MVIGFLVTIPYVATDSNFPHWIMNNAGWWTDKQITNEDSKINKIPDREVIATHSTISDSERAHGFIVRMKFPDGEKTFYSFSSIVEFPAGQTFSRSSPRIQLESVPSTDKTQFYKVVSEALSGKEQKKISLFIDIITPNGKVIETLQYIDCQITAHWVYTNTNKLEHRYIKADVPEMREITDFLCNGYKIVSP